jgi:hypothetical protein
LKLGPLRLNFSKSGIGVSTGIRGARVGINARGQRYFAGYFHGLTYRQNLGTMPGVTGPRRWPRVTLQIVLVALALIAAILTLFAQ